MSTKTEERDQALIAAIADHQLKLRSVIGQQLRDPIESEDVFQEVIEEYIEAYDLGEMIESLGAWLVTVAKNKILDRFRRQKNRNDYTATNPSEGLSRERPDDEHVRSWLRSEIVDALAALPQPQREAFVKHELEGKSFAEIAEETGESVNTLLSRKKYAVNFLRDHLKEIYDELE